MCQRDSIRAEVISEEPLVSKAIVLGSKVYQPWFSALILVTQGAITALRTFLTPSAPKNIQLARRKTKAMHIYKEIGTILVRGDINKERQ